MCALWRGSCKQAVNKPHGVTSQENGIFISTAEEPQIYPGVVLLFVRFEVLRLCWWRFHSPGMWHHEVCLQLACNFPLTVHPSCHPTRQHHNSYNRTENHRQCNTVWPPDNGRKDTWNTRNNCLPINHCCCIYLVSPLFTNRAFVILLLLYVLLWTWSVSLQHFRSLNCVYTVCSDCTRWCFPGVVLLFVRFEVLRPCW